MHQRLKDWTRSPRSVTDPQVLRADSCSTDGLHQLHIRGQKAFAQHTLADHAGRTKSRTFIT
jgi:hypothetical protein